jgi:phosphatidylserine decarboxylase
MPKKIKTRIEQLRQARQIHGGTIKMCAAALGVKLARVHIPSRRLRARVYGTIYGRKYAALTDDQLDRPLCDYRTLNELFTRGVRPELRPLPLGTNLFLSPCDSRVQDIGRVHQDTLLTVKGIDYSLASLAPGCGTHRFENGHFGIFFLSPVDCHRVFSPRAARLHEIIHVPGRRLLVHPPYQRKEFPVFALNERMILRLQTDFGACLLVMVAGWGVGNITFPLVSRWRLSKSRITSMRLDPIQVERGQWIATFELGSTVIMIVEPQTDLTTMVTHDQKLNYGQPIFSASAMSAQPLDTAHH